MRRWPAERREDKRRVSGRRHPWRTFDDRRKRRILPCGDSIPFPDTEAPLIHWLFAICVFWLVGAVFFGGVYDAETGSAGRQALGLLLNFAVFLGIFALLRFALVGLFGLGGESGFPSTVWGTILPTAIPTMLIGRIGRLVFGLVGVTMARKVFSADMH